MELRTVNGKKQYGYLKKPLKDMLDFIVDELEKMPEVATYYSLPYGVRVRVPPPAPKTGRRHRWPAGFLCPGQGSGRFLS